MTDAQIDELLWTRARELAASPEGLVIDGLGTISGGQLTASTTPNAASGHDAPKLVVRVADELGVEDDVVRSRLRAAVRSALASAVGRPAPLGTLGLIEDRGGQLRFHPSRRTGAAPPDAVERAIAAWRAPADGLEERVVALVTALGTITGALAVADQRRLLDELDYDLDPPEWERFGDRIIGAVS